MQCRWLHLRLRARLGKRAKEGLWVWMSMLLVLCWSVHNSGGSGWGSVSDPIPIQDCKAGPENSTHLPLPKYAPLAQHEAPSAPDKSNLTIHQDQELEAFVLVLYPG